MASPFGIRILEWSSTGFQKHFHKLPLLSCSPETARSSRSNFAISYVNHMCSLRVVCQTSNSGRIHVRILETLSQIAPLSCSPERARNWRSNSAVSYLNHMCSLWLVCQTSNSGGIHVRILETLSQIAPLSWSPERARSWRNNFATSYVNHV